MSYNEISSHDAQIFYIALNKLTPNWIEPFLSKPQKLIKMIDCVIEKELLNPLFHTYIETEKVNYLKEFIDGIKSLSYGAYYLYLWEKEITKIESYLNLDASLPINELKASNFKI